MYNLVLLKNPNLYTGFVPNSVTVEVEYLQDTSYIIYLKSKKTLEYVAWIRFSQVPYCCGAFFIYDARSTIKGMGKYILAAAIRAAELGGYSIIQCIIPNDKKYVEFNAPAFRLFEAAGFNPSKEEMTVNMRTENELHFYYLRLKALLISNITTDPSRTANLKPLSEKK